MAIDHEVIPFSSNAGKKALRYLPKWTIYGTIGIVVLIVVGILKTLLPLAAMSLILCLIWKQARNY